MSSEVTPLAPRLSLPGSPEYLLSSASPPESVPTVISNGAFSKTWILPPRKKPGRKAANGVPPTKRQAQNRAAQKAFRDRKAHRVIELEQENKELREQLNRIEAELIATRTAALNGVKNQQTEYQPQSNSGEQLASPTPSAGITCDTCTIGKDCACLDSVLAEPSAQAIQIPQTEEDSPEDMTDEKCGLCSSGSCLCEDLGIRSTRPKKSTLSSPTQGIKRKRSGPPTSVPIDPVPESFPLEIDFTSAFSSVASNTQTNNLSSDSCGFCAPGTPCVCLPNTLPPIQSDPSTIVPDTHPEAVRRSGNVNIPVGAVPCVGSPMTIASGNSGCTGEPGTPTSPSFPGWALIAGTCAQCRADPMSTLFCQTLSRRLETPVSSVRLPPRPTKKPERQSRGTEDTYLPCSAVYQTISRHRNFNKMSLEVIVNGLANGEHRGMEFSVGGVHGVLKEMDMGDGSAVQ